ncbi:MAG: 50S ribosomal protein L29 [Candidatus Omnitrophica bacterium]|nr:50S ribosomal protein L29 [Candidatus Omnitrophota bacterium]
MTIAEVRELAGPELDQKVAALKQQLFDLRVQAKLGRLEKGLELRNVRRAIARCLTVQRERMKEVKS